MEKEMFVHYKRPSKKMKARMRHARAGGGSSIFDSVIVTGTTRTVNLQDETRCEACQKSYHDREVCQNISLKRIADALEKIAEVE